MYFTIGSGSVLIFLLSEGEWDEERGGVPGLGELHREPEHVQRSPCIYLIACSYAYVTNTGVRMVVGLRWSGLEPKELIIKAV